jgi:hypothetical protein
VAAQQHDDVWRDRAAHHAPRFVPSSGEMRNWIVGPSSATTRRAGACARGDQPLARLPRILPRDADGTIGDIALVIEPAKASRDRASL